MQDGCFSTPEEKGRRSAARCANVCDVVTALLLTAGERDLKSV